MEPLTLRWRKCQEGNWCSFENLNLEKVADTGVYIIWHQGDPSEVVRVGQGIVKDRLAAHRQDPKIMTYKDKGLLVTWAAVPESSRNGVENYLAALYEPLVGERFPDVQAVRVNDPFA